MILTKEEIERKRNLVEVIPMRIYKIVESKFHKHSDRWDYFKVNNLPRNSGQLFLYETVCEDNDNVIFSYPKIGTYLDSYRADQTIEVEWIDHRRTWEYNTDYEFVSSYDGKTYSNIAADNRSELKYLTLWSDQMLVYGVWDKMPGWKELRQSYERTWWFYRDQDKLRDIQIDRILR